MSRYWRIYRTFFVSSLSRELEFRANFFAKIAQNAVWITFFLVIILVIYGNTKSVAGWNRGEAFVLAATCFTINAVYSALFESLMEIPEHVRKGTLDFIITKPIDTQFWISVRKFNFDQIGTFVAGIALIVIGLVTSKAHPSVQQWLAYLALTGCATILFYSLNLALMTLGIWLVRVDNLWVLGETIMQVSRYPIDIYGRSLRVMFTYFLPLGLLATIPARQLVHGLDYRFVGLGVVWALVSFAFARNFWRFALNQYTSASS